MAIRTGKKSNIGEAIENREKVEKDTLVGKRTALEDMLYGSGENGEFVILLLAGDKYVYCATSNIEEFKAYALNEADRADIQKGNYVVVFEKKKAQKTKRDYYICYLEDK